MTEPIIKIHSAGIVPSTAPEIKRRLDEAQRLAYGADLSSSPHVATEQWSGILAVALSEMGQAFSAILNNSVDVDRASGQSLDALARLLDIRRGASSYTTVMVTFTGTPGTFVRAGTRAISNIGIEFVVTIDGTIGDDGNLKLPMRSISRGNFRLDVGGISRLATVFSGIDSVFNETPGVTGNDAETDAQFRKRFLARTAHSSIGPKAAMLAALEEVDAGRVTLIENSTDKDIFDGGVWIPSHGILIIAEKGNPIALTRAIENHRGMGVATTTALIGSHAPTHTAEFNGAKLRFNGTEATLVPNASLPLMSNTIDIITRSLTKNPYRFLPAYDRAAIWSRWDPDMTGLARKSLRVSNSARVRLTPKPVRAYTQVSTPEHPNLTPDYWYIFVEYDKGNFRQEGGLSATLTNKVTGQTISSSPDISASAFGGNIIFVEVKRLHSNQTGIPDLKSDLENNRMQVSIGASQHYETNDRVHIPALDRMDIIHDDSTPQPPQVLLDFADNTTKRIEFSALHPFQIGSDQFEWKFHMNGSYTTNTWNRVDFDAARKYFLITSFTEDLTTLSDMFALVRTIASDGTKSSVAKIRVMPTDVTDTLSIKTNSPIVVDGKSARIEFNQWIGQKVNNPVSHPAWNDAFPDVKSGSTLIGVDSLSFQDQFMYMNLKAAFQPDAVVSWIDNWTDKRVNHYTDYPDTNDGLAATNTTHTAYENHTEAGVPSVPDPVWAAGVETGNKKRVNLTWHDNGNGGISIDSWEVQASYDRGNNWGEWTAVTMEEGDTTEGYLPVDEWPTHVRMRVGNANVRPEDALGLPFGTTMYPFVRPIENPIAINMTIKQSDDLPAGFHDTIRNSLVERVESTPIGERLPEKDLRALIEQVVGIGVTTFDATVGPRTLDQVYVIKLTRWTLKPSDIVIGVSP